MATVKCQGTQLIVGSVAGLKAETSSENETLIRFPKPCYSQYEMKVKRSLTPHRKKPDCDEGHRGTPKLESELCARFGSVCVEEDTLGPPHTESAKKISCGTVVSDFQRPLHSTNSHTQTLVDDRHSLINDRKVKLANSTQPPIKTARVLREMSPLSYGDIACDHYGKVITGMDGIKLTVPKDAIKKGDFIEFQIAIDLYGPFKLPSHCQANLASPYYWIGVSESYHFQKPIRVEFEHHGACDPSHYQLLCCEDDDESYTMRPVDYELSFEVRNNTFLCSFQTYHFCSYCLFHRQDQTPMNQIGALYLIPQNVQSLEYFSVEIWFSFPISCCLKRNEELYKKKGMVLATSYIFEASCDANSKSYFTLRYDKNVNGWRLDHSLSTKISAKQVNFYNYYTNDKDLHASEECYIFPPRFILNVAKPKCNVNLNTEITVTLHNADSTIVNLYKFLISDLPHHHCDNNQCELDELTMYSKRISSYWKDIAMQLEIPSSIVSTIDNDHPHIESKCYEVFTHWLQNTKPPLCWCHFIQALYSVGLDDIAEEVKKHLKVDKPLADAYESIGTSVAQSRPNLYRLMKFLKDVPSTHLNYLITCLLSKESAVDIIRDIEHSGDSKENNIKNVCREFLKEENPSWTKVYRALKEAECDNLAKIIEVCFLPV